MNSNFSFLFFIVLSLGNYIVVSGKSLASKSVEIPFIELTEFADEPKRSFKTDHFSLFKTGEYKFTSKTPSQDYLKYIEKNTVFDDTFDNVHHVPDKYKDFYIDSHNYVARSKREIDDNAVPSDPHLTKAQRRSMAQADSDVVDLQRPVAQRRGFSASGSKAIVDLAFVIDYEYSKKFNFNSQNLLNYLTIMVNSVNSRYSLMEDPKVNFKLTGTQLTKSLDAQPYIEKAKNGTNGYTYSKILDLFSVWAAQNMKNLPPHDVLVLLLKVESDSDSAGIAFLRGACWLQREGKQPESKSQAVAVVMDDAETFQGAFTLAHELAHNLGAPHDGKPESKDCSFALGHVMSYEGWGTLNKFHFSKCSKDLMKKFLESTGAFCLYKDVATPKYIPLPANKDVGDVLSPNQRCKIEAQSDQAFAADDSTADDFCRNVICRTPTPGSLQQRILQRNKRPPGENTPCGRGGKCTHGVCVGNKESPTERLDLKNLCPKRSGNPEARLFVEANANDQCDRLRCSLKQGRPFDFGEVLDGSFPCGVGGVCQNKKCVGNKEVTKAGGNAGVADNVNLTAFCIERTGYAQATISDSMLQSEYCKVLKCDWMNEGKPKIRTVSQYIPPDNSYPCGFNGKCVKQACVEQSQDRFDMNKLCQYLLRNPKGRVTLRVANAQCSKLSCSFPSEDNPDHDMIRSYEIVPEDGSFPCGNKKGKCKNKVCEGG